MAIERELKFRVPAGAAPRTARALALGAPQRLVSVYFDTSDEALRRARVALRLRRAGRGWLQTVKSDMAPLARGEWETEAPAGRLDLARLPLAEIRAATGLELAALAPRLRPRFETRFARRRADLRLADATIEAALDRGALIAGTRSAPILELELELKNGAPDALLRYAQTLVEPLRLQLALESKAERGYQLAHGVQLAPPRKWQPVALRDATPHAALAQLVSAALAQAGANAPGVLASEDPEYLHQLRVAWRRLRAALVTFRALAPNAKGLKRRLRALSPALGSARDWDVFVASLPAALPKGDPLLRRARAQQRKARLATRTLLSGPVFTAFLLHGFAWVEKARWQSSPQSLVEFATQSLERLHGKAMQKAKRMDWQHAADRHELRIRVKRLRYACDSLAETFAAAAVAPYLVALEVLQDDLGELNDLAVARRLAAELGGEALLARRLGARERRLIVRLSRDWAAFAERRPFWRSRN